MKRSRAAALLVGAAAALTLGACGVPPSGVIQAGEPASGISRADAQPASSADVYFLVNGVPAPYGRKVVGARELSAVLALLFDGPAKSEAAESATTELPRMIAAPHATTDNGTVSVLLPGNLSPFSHAAMLQLTCTVTHALVPLDSRSVTSVGGTGGADASVQGQGKPAPKNVRAVGNGWTRTLPADACPFPVRP
ncbi:MULTISPECIES: hypothetical protein [unclassified Streptomyces]|uniref:hypothetical protein n=1 Tax=unclassified Streptomyces TaxID=2593676 RepID=UPI0037F919C9